MNLAIAPSAQFTALVLLAFAAGIVLVRLSFTNIFRRKGLAFIAGTALIFAAPAAIAALVSEGLI